MGLGRPGENYGVIESDRPTTARRDLSFSDIKLKNDQLKIFLNGGKLKNINSEDNDYRIYDLSSNFLGLGNVSDNVLALKRLV